MFELYQSQVKVITSLNRFIMLFGLKNCYCEVAREKKTLNKKLFLTSATLDFQQLIVNKIRLKVKLIQNDFFF